jgi:hypothetical protein
MSKTQNIHQKKCIPKNCHWYQYMVSSSSQAVINLGGCGLVAGQNLPWSATTSVRARTARYRA